MLLNSTEGQVRVLHLLTCIWIKLDVPDLYHQAVEGKRKFVSVMISFQNSMHAPKIEDHLRLTTQIRTNAYTTPEKVILLQGVLCKGTKISNISPTELSNGQPPLAEWSHLQSVALRTERLIEFIVQNSELQRLCQITTSSIKAPQAFKNMVRNLGKLPQITLKMSHPENLQLMLSKRSMQITPKTAPQSQDQ